MPDDSDLSRSLLREVLADPPHLPETLALFAVRRMGPRAKRAAESLPRGEPVELRARLVARGRRNTVSQGAFVGGPFLVLVPVAFCAALLSQARLALDLAALDGRDPTGSERAAELLVLQGVYGDVGPARQALNAQTARLAARRSGQGPGQGPGQGSGRRSAGRSRRRSGRACRQGCERRSDQRPEPHPHRHPARRTIRRIAALWTVTVRMARLLGLLAPPGSAVRASRWQQAAHWSLLAVTFAVGMVAPLVWLPYMARAYDAGTARFADRATRFYFDAPTAPPRRRPRPGPPGVAARVRVLGSLLVPVAVVVGVLVTDVSLDGSHWPVVVIALTAASLGMGALWLWCRRRG
ncbi:hypothetical protein ACH4UM_15855 [Streptomyces sp. NPDC020801]|uniref:hypothetical protein n=1 Tax=Streptomyces sp. NPDC020801 TaxID=3365093 RepID=UPI0037A10EBE